MIRNYFLLLWRILSQPSAFFSTLELHGGLAFPLSFALITHWIGTSMAFLWKSLIGDFLMDWFESSAPSDVPATLLPLFQERVSQWFLGVGPVILDPFITLCSLLVTSVFVFAGARILITPRQENPITYESILRVLCFGSGPSILAVFPIFGAPLSSLCILISTVIGLKTVYQISTRRALVVFLFPNLLFIGIIGFGIFTFTALILKLL